MATFCKHPSTICYIVAKAKREADKFAATHGLNNYRTVTRVENLPREEGLWVILLPGYDKMEDYECFFGVGGLFYDFKANIYYSHEVPTVN